MKPPRHNFWLLLFFILTLLSIFFLDLNAQAISLPSRTIEVFADIQTAPLATEPTWNFLDKLTEAKGLVASSSLNLKVGKKDYIYYERRISRDRDGNIAGVTQKKLTDPDREIQLVLIDLKSGDLEMIKITERGNDITSPNGYEIRNVERPNGITNNAWNTCRQVVAPQNKAIILNVWPHYVTIRVANPVRNKSGKVIRTTYINKEVVENVVYSPYCEDIHLPEFVNNGQNYRKSLPQQAMQILRERKVVSKAFPDKLVADVEYLKLEYFERLPLIEHMDYGEFTLNPKKSSERVDVILGTNLSQAYSLTCSKAKACGQLQYTKRTWNSMRTKYPLSRLPVFESGVMDPVVSMAAAILLYDNNLQAAIKAFGQSILNDTNQLEEMLAANYNGGTVRPYGALRASILKNLEDWLVNPMRTETKQYIEKLRYIRESYN